MNVILTAGASSRMGDLAPHGCKALTPLHGRPIIEWQLDVIGGAAIVCRSEHRELLRKYGRVIVNDDQRGAADALRSAMQEPSDGPVTVVYADSFFTELPEGDAWVGVQYVDGGRCWDLVYSDGHCDYAPLPAGMKGRACVGLYRFPDPWTLALRVTHVTSYLHRQADIGMAPIVNNYPGLAFMDVPSWHDVGTPEALQAMEAA